MTKPMLPYSENYAMFPHIYELAIGDLFTIPDKPYKTFRYLGSEVIVFNMKLAKVKRLGIRYGSIHWWSLQRRVIPRNN